MTFIGDSAFAECVALAEATLPEGVQSIGWAGEVSACCGFLTRQRFAACHRGDDIF